MEANEKKKCGGQHFLEREPKEKKAINNPGLGRVSSAKKTRNREFTTAR